MKVMATHVWKSPKGENCRICTGINVKNSCKELTGEYWLGKNLKALSYMPEKLACL